ncbi:porin, partial [Camelimonas fluminis]
MTKSAPVEYVKVCATHGVGFFYIPGTDTCIRIGG